MAGKLYFDSELLSGCSTWKQLYVTSRDSKIGKTTGELRACFEARDAFTLPRPVRKTFPRNPYTLNNIMDVWECNLVDVHGLSKYKDGIMYLLIVIGVF